MKDGPEPFDKSEPLEQKIKLTRLVRGHIPDVGGDTKLYRYDEFYNRNKKPVKPKKTLAHDAIKFNHKCGDNKDTIEQAVRNYLSQKPALAKVVDAYETSYFSLGLFGHVGVIDIGEWTKDRKIGGVGVMAVIFYKL